MLKFDTLKESKEKFEEIFSKEKHWQKILPINVKELGCYFEI